MRGGWKELGVVDTIYEDEDDESFNSLSFTPSPDPALERSVKEWYVRTKIFYCFSPSLFPSRLRFICLKIFTFNFLRTQATGVKPDVVVRIHGDLFHLHRVRYEISR